MSDILRGVRDGIRDHSGRFVGLMPDFVKIGFLGNSPLLPAIAVIPSNQTIIERRSNRQYIVYREVALQIYEVGSSRAESESRLHGHLETLNRILRNDQEYFMKDRAGKKTAFDFDWGRQIIPGQPSALPSGGIVMEAVLLLMFKSKWWRPVQASTKPKKYAYLSDKEAFNRVFNRLERERIGGSKLAKLRAISRHEGAPRTTGLSAAIRAVAEVPTRYGAALDLQDTQFEFTVWSRMLPDEVSLLENSDIAEAAWEIVDEDETFGGAFYDSNMDSIQWRERQGSRTVPAYYETLLAFTCRKPQLTLAGTKA